ncbi:MAG: histidine kinase, partial [Verrucomicrobiaceae bacterium]
MVDLVALVPARQFDDHGIDPNFELPEDFRVLLVDEEGKTLKVLAEEHNTRSDPVRKGHPFCYRVDPPLRCSGLRVEARRMYVDPARPEISHFMAWGEIFCFNGERNVAREATVTASDAFKSLWPWKPSYVVDEITGLGLADLQDSGHLGIGWLSSGIELQQDDVWVQVNLGSVRSCDGIRMFPPERPEAFLIPGLYYPRRFLIEASLSGKPGTYLTVFSQDKEDFDNPGHHAVTLHWPKTEARFVRVSSLALRRVAKDYPAFMGFSELQILHEGENIALNCAVDASEYAAPVNAHGNLFWSAQSLTDGYTSRGKILSTRQWMELLERRYKVESAMHQLDIQSAAITIRFHRGVITVGWVLGCSMLVALIALPIRHRRRESQALRALRAQIAADLHDEIGSSLGSIQLLTEAALRKPDLAANRLTTIRLLSTGAVASLRDIVWLLRPGSAFQNPVLGHFRETAAILLEGLEWDFTSDEASRECRLARETNRHLLLFFREALHNAVRHAKCRSIMIRTSLQNQIFTLEV